MLFFKTSRGQVVLNFIFAFFAAVVILGALFKIRHWPAADEMITVGLLSVVISDGVHGSSSGRTTLATLFSGH